MENLQRVSAFLNPPRVPSANGLPDADVVASIAGEDAVQSLRAFRDFYRSVTAALMDLEDSRPGGAYWAQALAEDAAAVAKGSPPKTFAAQRLLEGDPHRWAHASALARNVSTKRQEALEALDRPTIQAAAQKAADAAVEALLPVVEHGWASRHRLSDAHAAREQADTLVVGFRRAVMVARWAAGGKWEPQTLVPGAEIDPGQRPTERERKYRRAGGYYLSLCRVLDGSRWLSVPQGVELPSDDDWDGLIALGAAGESLRTRGYAEHA